MLYFDQIIVNANVRGALKEYNDLYSGRVKRCYA